MIERENQAEAISKLLQHVQGVAIFPKLTKIGVGIGVLKYSLQLSKENNLQFLI
jgi:hypothetical protein